MAKLLLLRHAQSTWNAAGRWQGHADPPLSAAGELDAAGLAGRLPAIGRVVSSDLLRARRTAEIIAEALGIEAVEVCQSLRERDVGAWSGMTNDEIEVAFPGFRAAGRTPPGWEQDEAIIERAVPALLEIGSAATDAVVVTHGGVLRALEQHLGVARAEGFANLECRWFSVDAGLSPMPLAELVDLGTSPEPGHLDNRTSGSATGASAGIL